MLSGLRFQIFSSLSDPRATPEAKGHENRDPRQVNVAKVGTGSVLNKRV